MAYSHRSSRLQYWLDLRGVKQIDLARRSGWSEYHPDKGWSPRMVSHFCLGTKPMPVEAIYTFGEILEIPDPLVALFEEWFWDGTGEAPKRR